MSDQPIEPRGLAISDEMIEAHKDCKFCQLQAQAEELEHRIHELGTGNPGLKEALDSNLTGTLLDIYFMEPCELWELKQAEAIRAALPDRDTDPHSDQLTKEQKLAKVRNSGDWDSAAWNLGYDDYPDEGNPFEAPSRLYRQYESGWWTAKAQAEEVL